MTIDQSNAGSTAGNEYTNLLPLRIPGGWTIDRNVIILDGRERHWGTDPDDTPELIILRRGTKVSVDIGVSRRMDGTKQFWVSVHYLKGQELSFVVAEGEMTLAQAVERMERVVWQLTVDFNYWRNKHNKTANDSAQSQ